MDRYSAMQYFCRVVEQGSLAAGARALNLSNSVVTKAIQSLEAWTECRLLARTTRSMQLTDAGERFYAFCLRTLADTERTLTDVRSVGHGLTGRLVVAAPVSLTLSHLHEHLHAFQRLYPEIELEMRLNDQSVDLVREGIDVALRGRSHLEDSSLIAVPLMDLQRIVCAAPDYWTRHGKPDAPYQLADHNCLQYLLADDRDEWTFLGPEGVCRAKVKGTFRADNSLLLIDAMLRGVGLSLVPAVMVRDALARQALATALDVYRAPSRRLFAVYPSREHLPLKVQAFVAFLKQRLPPLTPSVPSEAQP